MKNAKQKAIRLAYVNLIGEEQYQKFKYDINFQDGTMKLNSKTKLPNDGVGFKFIATFVHYAIVIPNDLIGIETNNGWIKIESEKDLPSEVIVCFIVVDDKIVNTPVIYNPSAKIFYYNEVEKTWSVATQYQPIEKPKTPIY